MRNPTFTMPIKNTFNGNNSATLILNPNSLGSPKINRSHEITNFDEKNNIIMRKRSPYKPTTTTDYRQSGNGFNFLKQ